MKSTIKFSDGFARVIFSNGITQLEHNFFAGQYPGGPKKKKSAALAAARRLQPSVDEALKLTPPSGYAFAGIDEHSQNHSIAAGFRKPKRAWKEEKRTDARIGNANWLLYRLSTGMDATFIPVASDWENKFTIGRGAGARAST